MLWRSGAGLQTATSTETPRRHPSGEAPPNQSRWPGSGDDKASCEYMVGKLEEYGLENPHMEKFTHPGWIRGSSSLTVTEPGERDILCIALPMGLEGEIEAEEV